MTSLYSMYASAHVDGTIDMTNIQIGVMSGIPLATFRVTAGIQSHPAYAMSRCAMKVFAFAEAAKRFEIPRIQVSLRANLVSAESVTVLVSDGENDIEWHPSSDVRNAAEYQFAKLTARRASENLPIIPANWPNTPLELPIKSYGRPNYRASRNQR